MTTLPPPMSTRIRAAHLAPGDRLAERGIAPGVVERVWRDANFRDSCVTVGMRDGRRILLDQDRRVVRLGRN